MDVLLINNLNFRYTDYEDIPNIGLLNLASILYRNDIVVDIYDFSYEKYVNNKEFSIIQDKILDQIVEDIINISPKILGFTTMNDNYPFVIDLSSRIKDKVKSSDLDDIYIILGGPQASLTAKETINNFSCVDMIMIGEGEQNILFVVESILSNSLENLKSIPNLVYRNKGRIFFTDRDTTMIDVDSIQPIEPIFLDKFIVKDKIDSYPVDVGRGCPFACTFCCTSKFWNRKFRLKSNDNIIKEILYIKSNYDINTFAFKHDLFTVNKDLIVDFCEKLKESNANIEWGCSARIDTIDEELIDIMIDAGCKSIYFGIETGSQRMQKTINKNINLKEALSKIRMLSTKDITITLSFMYGFKEEKIEDLHLTLFFINELIKLNIKRIQLHRFTPFPSTKELELVMDDLYFDKNRINGFFYDKKFIKNYETLITDNISCFTNFCEFDTPVRKNTDNLSEFIYSLVCMYRFFNYIYYHLMKEFEGKYIYDIYDYYKNDLTTIINKVDIDSTYKDLKDEFLQVILNFIEVISYSLSNHTGNKNIIYMFHLGKEAFMMNFDNYKTKVIVDYPVDVVLLQNTKTKSFEYKDTKVCISKKPNQKISVRKI
ncbi:B12-binding domain-containing radical SAM protein [Keratinibaculum paraultunense]|uniref:B12-binding domain-containing radical SAM protein n=1 Tax=Keratinibaculum paraultunense TaxID=1278232 RepID=UPI00192C674A|nr:radical SAM protein [Keratinibaculum paraultunense]QQY79713.1 B12-binding domain-containing radical SAM protein [Keratinibaculum paraultunense]